MNEIVKFRPEEQELIENLRKIQEADTQNDRFRVGKLGANVRYYLPRVAKSYVHQMPRIDICTASGQYRKAAAEAIVVNSESPMYLGARGEVPPPLVVLTYNGMYEMQLKPVRAQGLNLLYAPDWDNKKELAPERYATLGIDAYQALLAQEKVNTSTRPVRKV